MVIFLERDADLHMAQLMPLPLTVSCFSEIQIGFTFLLLAHPGSPGQRAVKRVCVCVHACMRACVRVCVSTYVFAVSSKGFCLVHKCFRSADRKTMLHVKTFLVSQKFAF